MSIPLEVLSKGTDRRGLVEDVGLLLHRAHEASADHFNSSPVVRLIDHRHGADGNALSHSLDVDIKDLAVLAAFSQAPLALRGGTDRGKTALAERILNGLFGPHSEGWWRIEVSRGMTIDDLIDVDLRRLSESKLSEAISAAGWLAFPARLLDEVNRAPAKLSNTLLHLVDGSGFNVRGDLAIPVGLPYEVDGTLKRYSFSILTANKSTRDYDGVYEEDAALVRRVTLSVDLDAHPVTPRDVARMQSSPSKRTKSSLPRFDTLVSTVIRVYEALPGAIPFSALAHLLVHYLWGLGTCVRTRSGRLETRLVPALCENCHLAKSHGFCGRVGGLSEGLLLSTREIALGLAAIRAAKVLDLVRSDIGRGRERAIQRHLGISAADERLLEAFEESYLSNLRVEGEDIVAAYSLVAPDHVWLAPSFLEGQRTYEGSEVHAFADVATRSWETMRRHLRTHSELLGELAANGEIAPRHQSEVEALLTTEDAAMLAVISALRDEDLPLGFREALGNSRAKAA